MEHTNEEILEWYMKGFSSQDDKEKEIPQEGILEIAFNMGMSHFQLGDDVRSVDYLSEDEILMNIHSTYESDYLEYKQEYSICPSCNGSGEGPADGTTCWRCKGSGE
jgi:DnaJ-class molecular chaperone